MALISMMSLRKEYRRGQHTTHAVRGVSLEIERGESIAVTGPSGCGKTTLLNMVGLNAVPTSGELQIQGFKTKSFSSSKLSALRSSFFGYIVQDFALIEDYTALENVEIPLLYGPERLGRRERHQRVKAALARVGVENKVHQEARNLSGGQRQRVAIARALVSDPQVILADEPTGSLDSETGHEVFSLLIELVQEGKTLILVTHNLDLAHQCGRRVQMKDGLIV
ncbi:MAG: ABC transporter ATP-binding protein [Peptococcaceae bacterium]|nr:ABC transporter ATP-binding protein [Peptococcaceae bacterium]